MRARQAKPCRQHRLNHLAQNSYSLRRVARYIDLLIRLKIAIVLSLQVQLSRRSLVDRDASPTVSLTSHGERIKNVHLAIQSIGSGAVRPSRIILWLGDDEECPISRSLRRLERRGLEVRRGQDWGPHTKYFPYCLDPGGDNGTFVTADDDIMYPKWWLKKILEATSDEPDVIWCYRAHRIIFGPDGAIAPYADWKACRGTSPSVLNFATGVSGVAYPPHFSSLIRKAGSAFLETCRPNDDIWLHNTALRHSIRTAQILETPQEFASIPKSQRRALVSINVHGGRNDKLISAVYSVEDVEVLHAVG